MSYLAQIDAAPPDARWPLVRRLMETEAPPFFAEMRAERPVLELPELTLAFRFVDCALVLRRWHDFGVDLYVPKQGDYFMAQDDTADHWRDKSIMRSILDFEEIPKIRDFVGETTAEILAAGGGRIDIPKQIGRAVPVAMVREFFGLKDGDPEKLQAWSYWNQQDAFHNQPFQASPDSDLIIEERKKANIRLAFLIGRIMAKKALPAKTGIFDGDDSVTRLLKLSFSDGLKFPLKKVLFNAGGLLIGAVETTAHCVANVMAELLARPEALAVAQAAARGPDPAKVDDFAMEALRFRPAFPYFFRTCHKPTELSGGTPFATRIEPGRTVLAVTHSAMADPANFPDPTRFDADRSQDDNFTFGIGHHECLGRAIAKPLIGEIVRQILLLPNLKAEGALALERGVPEHYVMRWAA